MRDETEELEMRLDTATVDILNRMTKQELVERICVVALDADIAKRKVVDMQTKLYKAEAYVEQGRSMIEAVMDRWHEHDNV